PGCRAHISRPGAMKSGWGGHRAQGSVEQAYYCIAAFIGVVMIGGHDAVSNPLFACAAGGSGPLRRSGACEAAGDDDAYRQTAAARHTAAGQGGPTGGRESKAGKGEEGFAEQSGD